MWLAPMARLIVLAAMAPPAAPGSPPAAEGLPTPIATRQTLFAIPFRIDEPTDASRRPVEVQLFVSVDRGASWHLYSKSPPTRQHFMFRATSDGEYWFMVRTLDQSGQFWPREVVGPGLRVMVDTAPPKLDILAERGQAGQITARWTIEEPNLDAGSLKIQYRATADGPWQPVAVSGAGTDLAGPVFVNEATWLPPADAREVQIRAEVADRAGNPSVSHAQVKLVARTASDIAADPASASGVASQASPAGSEASSPWRAPADSASRQSDGSQQPAPLAADSRYAAPPGGRQDLSASYGIDRYAGYRYPSAGPPSGPVAVGASPPIQHQYTAPTGGNGQDAALPDGAAAKSPQHMVNSRLFELDYDVSSPGPSGIARVELWATRDGGRSWKSFALDDDNRSPLLVKVDEEGIYGFRVVVTGGTGFGGKPPQSGELPDVVVVVDLTRPTARILSASRGTSDGAGNLIVTWQATDQILADQPVSISLSESPGGPWTTIATGLENTGRYAWPIDDRAPATVYLRLEVRDKAGNVGTFETTEPVVLDQRRPSVQIREVRPVGETTWKPPKRYYFR
ncbi:MAG: hypothetical protein JXB62_05835 [Pirellulales bacterium]|nr:hypothetical protein [Pirellulales bacterium]